MIFLLLFFILASSVLQAQNIIKYEKNHEDAELSRVIFINSITNEIVKTFTPAEKCPYWNLTFKRSEGRDNYKNVKYFDLTGIDSLTTQDIPGLVNIIEWGHPLKRPYYAYAMNSAHVSNNHKWVIISSFIMIGDLNQDQNDGEYEAFAECLQIFDSNGNLFRTIYSDEVEMNDTGITDDGNYLFYDYHLLKDCFKDYQSNRRPGLRVINLTTMDWEMDINNYDTNMVYLYPYIAGDYICIFSETREDNEDADSIGYNTADCYNFKKNIKYTGSIEPSFKEFCNIIDVSEEGIYFRDWLVTDTIPVLYRFNKEFTKEIIK
jgi:hypothetical protein